MKYELCAEENTSLIAQISVRSPVKINLAAAFWINCKGLIELAGRPAKRALQ